MPAYVIYARKSTESEDRQVLSIDSQVNELQAVAMRRGIRVAEVLTESRSAKAPGRPVFNALMRRVGRGEVHGVVCWKMDRLARNHLDTGVVLQALADGKLAEVVTSDRTYTRDGNDRFMGNFELGMATKYIDDLRANVKRGNRARFQQGWVNYIPPLGYLNDLATKTIVKDPERFDLVRRMWDLLLTGAYRPSQILKIANDEWGFRTRRFKRLGGRPIVVSTLYKMFGNVFYTGVIRLRTGETYPGAHPPMVSREEFEKAQELLGRPSRPRPKRHEFPYTGILTCGHCGGAITAEQHIKPSGRRYVYYHCTHHRLNVDCREPAVSEPELERQIIARLRTLTIPPKTLRLICRKVEQSFAGDEARHEAIRASLAESLQSLDREKENLLSLRLRDLVDDGTFTTRKARLDQKRERLDAKLRLPLISRDEQVRLTLFTFEFASKAAGLFARGSTVQKRLILETTGLNYTLRSKKVLYELKNPLRIIAETGSFFNWCACVRDVRTWFQDTTEYFGIPDELMPQAVHSTS
jgi:DNA invertase Pin-like site-specific DNA recombinase